VCVTFYWKVTNGFNNLTHKQRGKSLEAELIHPLKDGGFLETQIFRDSSYEKWGKTLLLKEFFYSRNLGTKHSLKDKLQ